MEKRGWHIILMIIFLICFLYSADKLNKSFRSNKAYDEDYNETLLWLKENSDAHSVILTDWIYGPNIATFAGKGVVATTKVYPSEIKFVAERYKDASKFFFATSETDAMGIVKKYGATYIFVSKTNFQYKTCRYAGICNSNETTRSQIGNEVIIARMQNGAQFYNFEKIYDSKFFAIYKTVQPNSTKNDGLQQYDELIKNALNNSLKTERYSNVYGMILPHHLIYAYQIIADSFDSIEGKYDNVIILGPDHFGSSKNKISASSLEWETSFGKVTPNLKMIGELGLKLDEAAHVHEHSVRVMLPFIKYKFPDAKIVPIILNASLSEQEAVELGKKISQFDKTLIIASVDFSHDYDLEEALKKDAISLRTIQNFEKDKILLLDADSSPSLLALLTAMEIKNAKKTELLNYTNSGQLTEDYPKNVGYAAMIFQK